MMKIIIVFLLLSLSAEANDYIYNKYDGSTFGADGYPKDCNSKRYKYDNFFAGSGVEICNLAKQLNLPVTVTSMTTLTAVMLKRGRACELTLSSVGSNAVNFISKNYPITWNIVRIYIWSNDKWGYIKKSDCDLLKLGDSSYLFNHIKP